MTPYTHEAHAKACARACEGGKPFKQWVQVKTSGSACCAVILDAWSTSDGLMDFWKLQSITPLAFVGSFPVKAVAQCSGLDGGCFCAGEAVRGAPLAGGSFPAETAQKEVTCL